MQDFPSHVAKITLELSGVQAMLDMLECFGVDDE